MQQELYNGTVLRLSVIIPTHRRSRILEQCLRRLERQTTAEDLDVIVVHDGRDSDTARLVRFEEWKLRIRYMEIEKSQQGIARNRGVVMAAAPLTLFIGDDIFLAEDACERHVKAHSTIPSPSQSEGEGRGGGAVLGYATWDPACSITPVMRWLEESGWQFGHSKIAKYAHNVLPVDIQHFFTYTSNISIPTELARSHPFREDVTLYGWEDMEWGMRLKDAGVRLLYEPDIKGLHHHHMTLEDSLKRMETIGQSAVTIEELNPAFRVAPQGWKRVAYEIAALLPTTAGKHRRAFLKGLRTAKNPVH